MSNHGRIIPAGQTLPPKIERREASINKHGVGDVQLDHGCAIDIRSDGANQILMKVEGQTPFSIDIWLTKEQARELAGVLFGMSHMEQK